jgi:acetyltransferase-like isoleucine patch superfamily enzyme
MQMILSGLVFISPPFLKKWLLSWFCGAKFGKHAQIGWFSAVIGKNIEMGEYTIVRPLTLINLDGDVILGPYSEVSSFCLFYGSSTFRLGQGSYVGPQSLVNVDEEVTIGDGSALGARTMIFTHGSFFPYTEGYWVKLGGVNLGNRVWCAAGVFIHPGIEIGDDSFINSMSVVTQSIPPGSIAEGNPAKVVHPMERLKRKMTSKHVDLALVKIIKDFHEIGLRRELGVVVEQIDQYSYRFLFSKIYYQIRLVPSTATYEPEVSQDVRMIFVSNQPDVVFPENSFVFDVPKMVTPFSKDKIHTALRLFMLRYYGMRFLDSNLSS